ncbi:MAG TPA: hypothetical protein DHV19_20350 [Bacteroides cellulosilyticus]|nr:MAG TPA: hypothetical protein [Caudoviricetes sp.]HCY72351.1 hypothetical protein [Bacteroides cellulosilyticus]
MESSAVAKNYINLYILLIIIGKSNPANKKNKSYKFHFGQPFPVALIILSTSKTFSTFATLGM